MVISSRERETDRDRQTDRQTETGRQRQTVRQIDRDRQRQSNLVFYAQSTCTVMSEGRRERQRQRHRERERDRERTYIIRERVSQKSKNVLHIGPCS